MRSWAPRQLFSGMKVLVLLFLQLLLLLLLYFTTGVDDDSGGDDDDVVGERVCAHTLGGVKCN